MLFGAKRHIPRICPKTGKNLEQGGRYRWLKWLFPVTGLLSLIWFLIRVLPKPSRATYPCQRLVAPLASGFVVWIMGLLGSILAYRKAKRQLHQSRYLVGAVCAAVAVMAVWWSLSINAGNPAGAWTPTDPPNSPMGVAKGIFPGRVVWIYDPNATDWKGPRLGDGYWWQSNHTNQQLVDAMILQAIRGLAGESDISRAWDALFRYFNQQRGKGDVGYKSGEKITIKVNFVDMIASGGNTDYDFMHHTPEYAICSPQIIHSLLDNLVNTVGVAQSDITVGDPICLWCNQFYDMIHPDFPNVRYLDYLGQNGRTKFQKSTVKFYWSTSKANGKTQDYVLQSYVDAEYFINLASLKGHYNQAGITLCGKNHYGSLRQPNAGGYYDMHSDSPWLVPQSGRYRNMVDLMGHRHVGGKTFLCMIDGLYAGKHALGYPQNLPRKWQMQPFNNDWPSSIFVSQDQVSLDSVGFDFLFAEWPESNGPAHAATDDYLHEAALANNPPSGTFYDPEKDGTRLASLGVHEHWNNATSKQYSRNLGTGSGIELVTRLWTNPTGPVLNLTAGRRYNYIQSAINDADPGDEIVVGEGTYDENIDFKGKRLTIRSGSPDDPNIVAGTIIDGGSGGSAVTFLGGEDANYVLAGFTITGGKVGIYFSNSSEPVVRDCIVEKDSGVALEMGRGSKPAIVDCTMIGEVRIREVENLNTGQKYDYVQAAIDDASAGDRIAAGKGTFYENINFNGKRLTVKSSAPGESAVAADTIIKGGDNVVTFSSGEDANCVLMGLTIVGGNRGIYCHSSAPRITRCIIAGNAAQGIYAYSSVPKISNCVIANNGGAGIACENFSGLTITSCTISGNQGSGVTVNMSSPTVINSIVWANSPKQITGVRGTARVTYSDVQDGWPDVGDIGADPCFADANNGDYHLRSAEGRWQPSQQCWVYDADTSLAIDGGDPNSDWTAELWPHGKRINMGAYGGTPEASMSPSAAGNSGDLNHDDTVDMQDFAALAGNWEDDRVLMPENLDRRGPVDFNDLCIFTENWLWQGSR